MSGVSNGGSVPLMAERVPSDEEIVAYAHEHYSAKYAQMLADVLRVPSSFSRHLRESFTREMARPVR